MRQKQNKINTLAELAAPTRHQLQKLFKSVGLTGSEGIRLLCKNITREQLIEFKIQAMHDALKEMEGK